MRRTTAASFVPAARRRISDGVSYSREIVPVIAVSLNRATTDGSCRFEPFQITLESTQRPVGIMSGAECGGDGGVGKAPGDSKRVMFGGDDGTALQYAAQAFDVRCGPIGEIAQGALTDLAVLSIALAQENGRR